MAVCAYDCEVVAWRKAHRGVALDLAERNLVVCFDISFAQFAIALRKIEATYLATKASSIR